jgi:uncharacterized protein YciI
MGPVAFAWQSGHVLYIVVYAVADATADRIAEVYPRHLAYLTDFARDGQVAAIGPLLPAPLNGSMAVFRSREAAEAFPQGDPFVLEGLAVPSEVREWQALEFAAPPPG